MTGERLTALALTGLALTAGCTTDSAVEKGQLPHHEVTQSADDQTLLEIFESGEQKFEHQLRTNKRAEASIVLGACAIFEGIPGQFFTAASPAFIQVPVGKNVLRATVAYDAANDRFLHGAISLFSESDTTGPGRPLEVGPVELDLKPKNGFQVLPDYAVFNGKHQQMSLENGLPVDTVGAMSEPGSTLEATVKSKSSLDACDAGPKAVQ